MFVRVSLALVAVLVAGCGSAAPKAASPPATSSSGVALRTSAAVSRTGQGVALDLALAIHAPAATDLTLAAADVTLPAQLRIDAAAVPAGTVVGRGSATAAVDTSQTQASITVVYGGPGRVLLRTALDHPSRVRATIVGTVSGAHLRLAVPRDLQVIAGVPVVLTRLRLRVGRDGWLAASGCGPWPYAATATFSDGERAGAHAVARCR